MLQEEREQTESNSQSGQRQSSLFGAQVPSFRQPTHEQSLSGELHPVFGGSSSFGPKTSKHGPPPYPEEVVADVVEAVVDAEVVTVVVVADEDVVLPAAPPPPEPALSPHPKYIAPKQAPNDTK